MPNSGYFDVVFGSSGDLTAVPDSIQSNGSISYAQGWGPYYAQDPNIDPATALFIDRAQTNQIFYDITSAIQQYQQFGIPPFITTSMNNGTPFPYAQYATVFSGGVAYQSLIASNTDTPPSANWAAVPLGYSSFSTGDVKPTYKTTADTGWVMMNDGTIGSSGSGATTRANSDTLPLYTLLWNNISNTYCPVSTGRGVSAAADFSANKTLKLPLALGRAMAFAGAGSGLTSRALGQNLGDENYQSHTHAITDPGHTHTAASPSTQIMTNRPSGGASTTGSGGLILTDGLATSTTGITVNTAGTGSGGNMQPSSFMNVMIKL